jgi:hypothetical protein
MKELQVAGSPQSCPRCGAHVAEGLDSCPLCHVPLHPVERRGIRFGVGLWGLVALGGLIAIAAWTYRRHQ